MTHPTTGAPMEVEPMTNEQAKELQRLTRLDELDQMLLAIKVPDPETLTYEQLRAVSQVIESLTDHISERKKALRSQPPQS